MHRPPPLLATLAVMATLPWGAGQELILIADGLRNPVVITHAGDGSGRLFIAEQPGRIWIFAGSELLSEPFLDLRAPISYGGERGLLGLTFHPDHRENGLFFVHYSDASGDSVISRFRVTDDPDRADPASERVLLTIEQPFANHNGGQLAFGPDGYLYLGLGDGGGAGDPLGAGQRLSTLLGKLLRIDIDRGDPYAIPEDNPFLKTPDARAEIWAYGLRNPWRFSFDRETGDLFIGDVGQNRLEEIDLLPAGSGGGQNFGWNVTEGDLCFAPRNDCDRTGLIAPILVYDHGPEGGRSVTGGYVYRGDIHPTLQGDYLFGDFVSGRLWRGIRSYDGWSIELLMETGLNISTLGEDAAGELYLAAYNSGAVYLLDR